MSKRKKQLEEILQKLQDDDEIVSKEWNEGLFQKTLLLFPLIFFLITFLQINNDKNLLDLFIFIDISSILVFIGVVLNFLLTNR
tara:strand:- start:61 stop:312 length:252 start_codon:yes stop_codon:yes gene_type:complete